MPCSSSHTVKYRSGEISSTFTPRRIKNTLFHPAGIDILVSTPHLLGISMPAGWKRVFLIRRGVKVDDISPERYLTVWANSLSILSRVTHLVLDEADSLMDRSFIPTTSEIIAKVAPRISMPAGWKRVFLIRRGVKVDEISPERYLTVWARGRTPISSAESLILYLMRPIP
jgi:hypothetical protein